jgi:two-component system response regulator AtoC
MMEPAQAARLGASQVRCVWTQFALKSRWLWQAYDGTAAGNAVAPQLGAVIFAEQFLDGLVLYMTASSAAIMQVPKGPWVVPSSGSMRAIEAVIAEIANTSIPVLLIGESGTGKEVLARRIHGLSTHSEKLLAKLSCASMTAENLVSQLAAHLRPAGGKESADAPGTLLLDELGDLDSTCQARLLHLLPDGESIPATGKIFSRVISSTTRDLEGEARLGRFRSELYYRISCVCLRLPPLRERREDIPALVEFLLAKHASQMGRRHLSLSQEALRALTEYFWPGNIRELENVIRKIVALNDEELAISELRSVNAAPEKSESSTLRIHSLKAASRAASREAERELILGALDRTHWNRKRAAQELQISYKSLLYKLKQIGIEESGAN